MTLGEFLDYEWGFFYRQALELDRMRYLAFTVHRLAGNNKVDSPNDLMKIWQLDSEESGDEFLTGEAALIALKSIIKQ